MTKSQNQSQASSDEGFFNLQVSGCGYLSRVRWVNPTSKRGGRKSEPFLACAINALRGAVADPGYTYFDLKVSGEEAGQLVEQLMQDVDEGRKVFVAFKLGDIYPHFYERKQMDQNGKPTGEMETATLIKGRLLLISYVKVDDQIVYQRKDDEGGEVDGEREAPQGAEREPQQQGDDAETPRPSAPEEGSPARSQRRQASRPLTDRSRVREYAEAV